MKERELKKKLEEIIKRYGEWELVDYSFEGGDGYYYKTCFATFENTTRFVDALFLIEFDSRNNDLIYRDSDWNLSTLEGSYIPREYIEGIIKDINRIWDDIEDKFYVTRY